MAIAGSVPAPTRHVDRFAGLPGDVGRGMPIGVALGPIVGAIAMPIHDRRRRSA